jgi:hypothetical protein
MRLTGREVFGVVLIVLGGAFFLRNAGLVDLDSRALVPIILVVVGLLVILGSVAGPAGGSAAIRVPRGPAELELDVTAGAGRFALSGGAADLLDATSTREDIALSSERNGTRARVRLRHDGPWAPWGGRSDWQVRLASDVPAALDVTIGAGELDLDLLDIRLVGARVSLGAASASIRLPRPTGDVRLDVTLGAASLRVGVPAGVEARVTTSGGAMSVSGERETAGWAAARDRVSLNVSGGASSVRIAPA